MKALFRENETLHNRQLANSYLTVADSQVLVSERMTRWRVLYSLSFSLGDLQRCLSCTTFLPRSPTGSFISASYNSKIYTPKYISVVYYKRRNNKIILTTSMKSSSKLQYNPHTITQRVLTYSRAKSRMKISRARTTARDSRGNTFRPLA